MKLCTKCNTNKDVTEFTLCLKNKDKLNGICKSCRRITHLTRTLKNKLLVMNHYSNNDIKCKCCGVKELEFLAIDHKLGNGNKHRKEIGVRSGWTFYNWLIKNNFPDGFRVLCHNCNQATGNFGKCPHNNGI